MSAKTRMKKWIGMITGALVILLMGALLTSAASAAIVVVPHETSWAYGGSKSVSNSGTITTASGATISYDITAHSALSVVFNETNTTNTTLLVEGVRTVGFSYGVTFTSPKEQLTLNATGWERELAFANFTRNGTVTANGSDVKAIAFENLTDTAAANLTVSASWSGRSNGDLYGTASVNAHSLLVFSPPLGLWPTNRTVGESWTSSSTFSGSGGWTGDAYYHNSNGVARSNSISGNSSRTGTIDLNGTFLGTITLQNGTTADVFQLTLGGTQFRLADGIFMAPRGGDLLSGGLSNIPWLSSTGNVGDQVGTGAVDVTPGGGHIGLSAATTSYSPQTPNLNNSGVSSSAISDLGMSAVTPSQGSPALPSASLQAEPMSVQSAEALGSSILSGYSTTSGGPGGYHLFPIVVLTVVVVAGAVLVAYYYTEGPRGKRPQNQVPKYREAVKSPQRKAEGTTEGSKDNDPLDYLM